MKQLIFLILMGFVLIGSGCGYQIISSKNLTNLNNQVNRLQDEHQALDNLSFDERCSNNAQKFFKNKGYSSNEDTYISHWNKTLNKCFVSISGIHSNNNGGVYFSADLFNAVEGKSYAIFLSSGTVPDICELNSDEVGKFKKTCKSKQEFDDFVDSYMTDNELKK